MIIIDLVGSTLKTIETYVVAAFVEGIVVGFFQHCLMMMLMTAQGKFKKRRQKYADSRASIHPIHYHTPAVESLQNCKHVGKSTIARSKVFCFHSGNYPCFIS